MFVFYPYSTISLYYFCYTCNGYTPTNSTETSERINPLKVRGVGVCICDSHVGLCVYYIYKPDFIIFNNFFDNNKTNVAN